MPDTKQITPSTGIAPFQRTDDFVEGYANNLRFEPTVYDLKIIFGETDQSSGTETTQQHTAITLPWALVKLALFFLEVNVAIHELVNGKIMIPPNQIPAPPNPIFPENDPNAAKAFEIVEKIREDFLSRL
jgi:hypothetical protein